MEKVMTLAFFDGFMRAVTLFLIADFSLSIYSDNKLSLLVVALLILLYYVISHFISRKTNIKHYPVFYIFSLLPFLLFIFLWCVISKFGLTMHLFPQYDWDAGAGWSMVMLCSLLVIASIIERIIMTLLALKRRKQNDN